jgi:diacylglycerol kinase (ATP)
MHMPVKQWIRSANNAIEGILHAAKSQRHVRYHFYAAAVVVMFSYMVGTTKSEFLILSLAMIAVLVAEMLNTSVEYLVDMHHPERSEKARAAKDIAAGAVFITAFGAVVIGYIILLPYFKRILTDGFGITSHPGGEISVVAFIMVLIVVVLMKAYFGKGHPLRGGVPSGHAALAFSVWVSVSLTTLNLMASAVCLVLAAAVAASRVASKIHRPWEVALGGLIGAGITFALFQVFS